MKLNKKYGLINDKGKQITDCKYDKIWTHCTSSTLHRVFLLEGKYGLITEEGKEIFLRTKRLYLLDDKE